MRIIVEVLTNKKSTCFAIDLYYRWPFLAFELLAAEEEPR